jgi:hypothetical protein
MCMCMCKCVCVCVYSSSSGCSSMLRRWLVDMLSAWMFWRQVRDCEAQPQTPSQTHNTHIMHTTKALQRAYHMQAITHANKLVQYTTSTLLLYQQITHTHAHIIHTSKSLQLAHQTQVITNAAHNVYANIFINT